MKRAQLYQALLELAEKLEIKVVEKSFRNAGLAVQSGLCIVKGRQLFIMDRQLALEQKLELLADCLRQRPHEKLFLAPVVREYLGEMQSPTPPKTMDPSQSAG